jgi:demethylmenaquinone methyltransferase/2-methoxy-6-polyprenyl-1,4-benzoquinol methylase
MAREALAQAHVQRVYDRAANRYDLYHSLATLRSDERGRRLVVEWAVAPGNCVLDAGGGTATTALAAARRVGDAGRVTVVDLSEGMLAQGPTKARGAALEQRMSFVAGDILKLPFADESFDVVLSTYSLCPIYDPAAGALELYRLLKPGGRFACAHSVEPQRPTVRWLAGRVERVLWRFPSLSLGCRAVEVLPVLERAGARVLHTKTLGVPLWPFFVFAVAKPED